MPFTVTPRGTTEQAYVTSGNVGDTFTPNENDIICFASTGGATQFSTVAGWGATWVEIGVWASNTHSIHLWAARIPSSPGSSNVSFTSASTSYSGAIFQIEGVDPALPLGVGDGSVFRQAVPVSQYNTTSPLAIPALSAFSNPTNLSLTLCGIQANNIFTPQAGWNEIIQGTDTINQFNIGAFSFPTEDTSHTVEGNSFSYRWVSGVGLEIEESAGAPAQSVNAVTSDILDGSVGNEFTVSGFTGAITGAKLKSGVHETNVLNLALNAGTYTYDMPDISVYSSDTVGCPLTTAAFPVVLEVTNGTDTAEVSITYNPKVNNAIISLLNATTAEGTASKAFTDVSSNPDAPNDNSIMYYPTTNNTVITADSTFQSDSTSDVPVKFWDIEDGTWKPFFVLVPAADVTAPVLSGGSAGTVTSSGATPSVITNEANGISYMVRVPSGDTPSEAQVIAGQQSNGSAALSAENVTVSSTGQISFTGITGLPEQTSFSFFFVHVDSSGNASNVLSVDFTTLAIANQPPTANAGSNQTVQTNSIVNLTGSGTDSDGTIVSTVWTQVSGISVTLNNSTSLNSDFTAPTVTSSETLVFRLTVTDNEGATGFDDVQVVVNPVSPVTIVEFDNTRVSSSDYSFTTGEVVCSFDGDVIIDYSVTIGSTEAGNSVTQIAVYINDILLSGSSSYCSSTFVGSSTTVGKSITTNVSNGDRISIRKEIIAGDFTAHPIIIGGSNLLIERK